MACQLLEIVDGDLTVCYEYGEHRELCMNVGVWLTIYKHDASVSMPLQSLGVLLAQDTPALFRETGVLSKSELGRWLGWLGCTYAYLERLAVTRLAQGPVYTLSTPYLHLSL